MIVTKLKGGLGNQMFQYAAGRALAERIGVRLLLDASTYGQRYNRALGIDKFQIEGKIATSEELEAWPNWKRKPAEWMQRMGILTRRYRELNFGFDPNWLFLDDNVYIEGYFQSEKYFEAIKKILVSEFQLKSSMSSKNQNFANMARTTNSVMVHVRRGDYVSSRKLLDRYAPCGRKYYERAIEMIELKIENPQYFVFSDDLDWVRRNLPLPGNPVFIDGNQMQPEVDVFLMAQGKNHIIANSTFSWWGAWLSSHKQGIVVAPHPWFRRVDDKDIYCGNWHQLEKI